MRGSIKRYLVGLPIVLGSYVCLLLLDVFPYRPIDAIGWCLLIFVGIPAFFFLECMGECVFSDRVSLSISGERFSYRRIAFAVLIALILGACALFFWPVFERLLGPFLGRHFGGWQE